MEWIGGGVKLTYITLLMLFLMILKERKDKVSCFTVPKVSNGV